METFENLSLAKIVSLRPETATLFEKHQLDFCCRGKQTLSNAMAGDREKLEHVKKELKKIFEEKEAEKQIDFEEISLSELVDYILSTHHRYVRESMGMMHEHAQKISSKHGERHTELKRIAALFADVKEELEQHMMKEEIVLFPAIKRMEAFVKGGLKKEAMMLLDAPVNVMEAEHEKAGKLLEEIRKLSNDYVAPSDACTTYRLTFDELKRFEFDLHQHVHLENNILFPKAIEMQRKLNHTVLN